MSKLLGCDVTMDPLEATNPKPVTIHRLNPRALKASRRGLGIAVTVEGEGDYDEVTIARTFPLSEPDRFWSLHDSAGKEIGVIVEPAELDPATRQILQEELDRRYFAPVIRRILSITEQRGNLDWVVETDRGRSTFTTHMLREATVQPVPFRYLISDVDGNRYDVVDLNTLDAKSRLLLMGYL